MLKGSRLNVLRRLFRDTRFCCTRLNAGASERFLSPLRKGGNAQRKWDELETCARRTFEHARLTPPARQCAHKLNHAESWRSTVVKDPIHGRRPPTSRRSFRVTQPLLAKTRTIFHSVGDEPFSADLHGAFSRARCHHSSTHSNSARAVYLRIAHATTATVIILNRSTQWGKWGSADGAASYRKIYESAALSEPDPSGDPLPCFPH